jgi:hypothetical protein
MKIVPIINAKRHLVELRYYQGSNGQWLGYVINTSLDTVTPSKLAPFSVLTEDNAHAYFSNYFKEALEA